MTENNEQKPYHVEVRHGWSYVVGDPLPKDFGPWRYRYEAQELADELNATAFRGRG